MQKVDLHPIRVLILRAIEAGYRSDIRDKLQELNRNSASELSQPERVYFLEFLKGLKIELPGPLYFKRYNTSIKRFTDGRVIIVNNAPNRASVETTNLRALPFYDAQRLKDRNWKETDEAAFREAFNKALDQIGDMVKIPRHEQ